MACSVRWAERQRTSGTTRERRPPPASGPRPGPPVPRGRPRHSEPLEALQTKERRMLDDLNVALTVAAALGCGVVAGVFFAFSSFVMAAFARLPAGQGIAAMQ